MERYYSTKQVAAKLNIRPDTLQKAVWLNRVEAPIKAPSGAFLWTDKDIQRASWALLHRAYQPEQKGGTDE